MKNTAAQIFTAASTARSEANITEAQDDFANTISILFAIADMEMRSVKPICARSP